MQAIVAERHIGIAAQCRIEVAIAVDACRKHRTVVDSRATPTPLVLGFNLFGGKRRTLFGHVASPSHRSVIGKKTLRGWLRTFTPHHRTGGPSLARHLQSQERA